MIMFYVMNDFGDLFYSHRSEKFERHKAYHSFYGTRESVVI